jgi:NIMA (never in mitosis gene a)-related kinase
MKGLVLKILRGTYPPIPSLYSNDLKEVIAEMLQKDPAKRPSVKRILEKEFLRPYISELLQNIAVGSDIDLRAVINENDSRGFNGQDENRRTGENNMNTANGYQAAPAPQSSNGKPKASSVDERGRLKKLEENLSINKINIQPSHHDVAAVQVPARPNPTGVSSNGGVIPITRSSVERPQVQQVQSVLTNSPFIRHRNSVSGGQSVLNDVTAQYQNPSQAVQPALLAQQAQKSSEVTVVKSISSFRKCEVPDDPRASFSRDRERESQESFSSAQPGGISSKSSSILQDITTTQQKVPVTRQSIGEHKFSLRVNSNNNSSSKENHPYGNENIAGGNNSYLPPTAPLKAPTLSILAVAGAKPKAIAPVSTDNPTVGKSPLRKSLISHGSSRGEKSEEEQGYGDLLKSINECLTKQSSISAKAPTHDEEEQGLSKPVEDVKVLPKFLHPEGHALVLPGISDRDSLGLKLEALRVYLERQLGEDRFYSAYKLIAEPPPATPGEDEGLRLQKIIGGKDNSKFIPLIYQLIVCEDSYYSS